MSASYIILDPAVPAIFYFKHNEGASLINFIGNPNVDNIRDAISVLSLHNVAIRLNRRSLLT